MISISGAELPPRLNLALFEPIRPVSAERIVSLDCFDV